MVIKPRQFLTLKCFSQNVKYRSDLAIFPGSTRQDLISKDSKFNFEFTPIVTKEDPITGKPMDFTPEVENKVIGYALSQKLDILLFNPSKKVRKDSTQYKTPASYFQVGEYP